MKLYQPTSRIESIDLLRGVVIVIMALDHVRDYFHADAFLFAPTDLSQTNAGIFFTRWITHFCAPVFVFLAGTSAYQIGIKKGIPALSSFLLKRGLWLIILELTVINFAWFFNIHFSFIALTVIWALGMGMIVLAALVHLSFKWILFIGAAMVLLHNVLDTVHFKDSFLWALIHEQHVFSWGAGGHIFTGYGLVPWVGVMALGYCFGSLYTTSVDATKRKKKLLWLGGSGMFAFILIRLSNLYGDPFMWSVQNTPLYTFLSFLNTTKYPPSLLYLLMTLSPAVIFLALAEHVQGKFSHALIVFGRVPLFFYVIHIYAIHIMAVVAAMVTGFPLSSMSFNTWITDSPALKGYGFSLGVVYLIWIFLILLLYPLCSKFEAYKRNNKDKVWLSYL